VGSGIVADSVASEEYDECLLKARILREAPFALLETMRAEPGKGILYLDAHLRRLETGAAHWGVTLDASLVRAALLERTEVLADTSKVRLLVDLDGAFRIEVTKLDSTKSILRVAFARTPVDSTSPWLRFKTTRREVYDGARAAQPDADEVLLWNERGEVTEATSANVVVEMDGSLITPCVDSGLLPGILRDQLLAQGIVHERRLGRDALHTGQRFFLINALRGWREAVLVGDE
jgi:para-aminobenzoate synthetase/4-amino-4-deoxychorismate lyase